MNRSPMMYRYDVPLPPSADPAAKPKNVVRDEPKLTDAEKAAHKAMAAELRRGRGLGNKGRHAEAMLHGPALTGSGA